jgi:hypothetical protein
LHFIGDQAKWNELYEQYYKRHFVQGNACLRGQEEVHRFRKTY